MSFFSIPQRQFSHHRNSWRVFNACATLGLNSGVNTQLMQKSRRIIEQNCVKGIRNGILCPVLFHPEFGKKMTQRKKPNVRDFFHQEALGDHKRQDLNTSLGESVLLSPNINLEHPELRIKCYIRIQKKVSCFCWWLSPFSWKCLAVAICFSDRHEGTKNGPDWG